MQWLGALGGLGSVVGGVAGLFGAGDAEAAAQKAAQQAITQFQQSASDEEAAALAGGRSGLYGLTGSLRDALQRMGGGMGSGLARAGVYNSSAVGGAMAQEQASNAQQLSSYTGSLADRIAQMRALADAQAAQMQMGLAGSNLNFYRQQTADSEKGIASGLGALGQFGLAMGGPRNANSVSPGNGNVGVPNPVLPGGRRSPLPWPLPWGGG
jgi:hypothetical protein